MFKYIVVLVSIQLMISSVIMGQIDYGHIKKIHKSGKLKNSNLALSIRCVDDGYHFGYQADQMMQSASVMKVVTSLAGLDILGKDYTFNTQIAYTGKITGDTINGDLIIHGGGDPTLGSYRDVWKQDYKKIAIRIKKALADQGISCITGNLIINTAGHHPQGISRKWVMEDIGNYYGAPAYALNINENTTFITFGNTQSKGTATSIEEIRPFIKGLILDNHVKTNTPQGRDNAYVIGGENQYRRTIIGSIPVRKQGFTIKGSMPNPPRDAGNIILDGLQGMMDHSEVHIVDHHPGGKNLISISSPKLHDITRLCNHKSINLYADAIFQMIGKKQANDWSMQGGRRAINNWADTSMGIDTSLLSIQDGSGLSPFTYFTPDVFTEILLKDNHPSILTQILPRVGKEGTVKHLLRNSKYSGKFHLKSGSMTGVLTYGGLYTGPSGKKYVLFLGTNGYTCDYKDAKKNLEEILVYISSLL